MIDAQGHEWAAPALDAAAVMVVGDSCYRRRSVSGPGDARRSQPAGNPPAPDYRR
jgi:hypothetical protein